MSRNPKSFAIVFVQLASLAFLLLSGPLITKNMILFIIENIGVLLVLWAVYAMRIAPFNITPEIAKNSVLVTMGPYKYIRHPMYAGILLLAFSLVVDYFTVPRLIAGLILLITLLIKLQYEEKLLEAHFKDYSSYKKQTSRLIPFIY